MYLIEYSKNAVKSDRLHQTAIAFFTLKQVEDRPALEKFFFDQIKSHGVVPYLFYVDNRGNFIGVQKLDNGKFIAKVKDQSTGKNRNIYQLDEQGRRGKLIKSAEFDSKEYFLFDHSDESKDK